MARQSLKLHAAAIALEELDPVGMHRIKAFTAILKERGIIVTDDESIRQWEYDQARDYIERVRKLKPRDGSEAPHFLTLYEITADGKREPYWRRKEHCTLKEGAQHINYRNRATRTSARWVHYYFRYFTGKFGKRPVQKLLDFSLPEDPDANAEAQAG